MCDTVAVGNKFTFVYIAGTSMKCLFYYSGKEIEITRVISNDIFLAKFPVPENDPIKDYVVGPSELGPIN